MYIYCHPQPDCFVLSELFSVARHAGRSKPRSKPVQLYVRLSLRPLGHRNKFYKYSLSQLPAQRDTDLYFKPKNVFPNFYLGRYRPIFFHLFHQL